MSARKKIDQKIIAQYHQSLLDWFYCNKRQFPWRETSDPFHIIIAEILLRMTGVSHTVPIYEYLISKYPTPKEMASASLTDLESIIQPLGLHNRAKILIKLSRVIQEEYGGVVPSNIQQLQKLPGVGQYIANAVICFCFGVDKPLVDGGIGRVIRRVFGLRGTKSAYLDRKLWAFAEKIIPLEKAGEYNLALIDLDAFVCKPRNPICSSCPLANLCAFRFKEQKKRRSQNLDN